MRKIFFSLLVLVSASPALAEEYYAAQTYPTPQTAPVQLSNNYNPNLPIYNQPRYAPQPAQQPAAPAYVEPQPGEYGISPMNDLRQLNF